MGHRGAGAGGSILSSATEQLRQAVEAVAVRVTVREGETLFSQGEPGDALYIIERGEIVISVSAADGRRLALDVLREGEVFGEIALFGGDRTATATASVDCVLRRTKRSDILAMMRRHPELALDFIDLLCDRLRTVSDKLEGRTFLPVPARLADRLLYLEAKLGDGGRVMVSQADLAEFVGATREGVAKTLAVWRSRKWVALSRGMIHIVDRSALESVAVAPTNESAGL